MLAWTDWPARRRPLRSAIAATLLVATVGTVSSVDPVLGFVGAFLLLTSVRDALLPTRFELDERGVRLSNPLRRVDRDWARFGGWTATPEGAVLRGRSASPLLQRRAAVRLARPADPAALEALLLEHLGPKEAA